MKYKAGLALNRKMVFPRFSTINVCGEKSRGERREGGREEGRREGERREGRPLNTSTSQFNVIYNTVHCILYYLYDYYIYIYANANMSTI